MQDFAALPSEFLMAVKFELQEFGRGLYWPFVSKIRSIIRFVIGQKYFGSKRAFCVMSKMRCLSSEHKEAHDPISVRSLDESLYEVG